MSDLNEIKTRLSSVEQTRQITNAMYLLASAGVKRALTAAKESKDASDHLKTIISDIFALFCAENKKTPMINGNGGDTEIYVLFMSDRGLCGSFNSDVADFAFKALKKCQKDKARVLCYGSRGKEALASKNIVPEIIKPLFSHKSAYSSAKLIYEDLSAVYTEDGVGRINVIYNDHLSGAPIAEQLLPIRVETPRYVTDAMYFEPSSEEAVNAFFPIYLKNRITSMINSSSARENLMRVEAMKIATDNADEMIKELNIEMNMLRQQIITNESAEVAAVIENLNGC